MSDHDLDVTLDSIKDILRQLYGPLADKITKSRVMCVTYVDA